MGIIKVVCGIIFKADLVFICRRSPMKLLGGYWEFPGGRVEENERNEDTLRRELKEKLDMEVGIENYFATSKHSYDKFSIELISYICYLKNSNFRLIDHDKYEWVKPEDLMNWKLAPADIPIAKELIKTGGLMPKENLSSP